MCTQRKFTTPLKLKSCQSNGCHRRPFMIRFSRQKATCKFKVTWSESNSFLVSLLPLPHCVTLRVWKRESLVTRLVAKETYHWEQLLLHVTHAYHVNLFKACLSYYPKIVQTIQRSIVKVISRSDGGLMLETSAWKLFTVDNLRYQLSW